MKYIKKPVEIEAVQIKDGSFQEICAFLDYTWDGIKDPPDSIVINTLEGRMTALKGDWIIKGVKGEFYSCRGDIFELTYEPVTP